MPSYTDSAFRPFPAQCLGFGFRANPSVSLLGFDDCGGVEQPARNVVEKLPRRLFDVAFDDGSVGAGVITHAGRARWRTRTRRQDSTNEVWNRGRWLSRSRQNQKGVRLLERGWESQSQ